MLKKEPKKLWLVVEGKVVSDHGIEAYTFGQLLTGLQRIIDVLKISKYGRKHKKDIFRLFLTRISPGSLVAELQPRYYEGDIIGGIPFNEVASDFQKLVQVLIDDPEEFKTELEREFADPSYILRFLQGLDSIWSKRNRFVVKTGLGYKEPEKLVELPPARQRYIKELIEEYIEKSSTEIKGVIIRIKGDEPRNFTIRTLDGENIKCHYPPEWERDIMSLFKSPVVVKGVISKKARTKEIETITDLKKLSVELIGKIGKFSLREPIPFRVSYDEKEDLLCLENDELAIYGYGSTYSEVLSDLEDSLESLIVGFLAFPDERLSEKSLEIKEKLSKYIDIEKYRKMLNPRVIGD